METIVINTAEPSKMEQIIAFLNSLNVSFELKKLKKTKEYDPEFVKMVLEASKSNNRRVLDDAYKKELFGQL
jgi:F420-0:gamma-glutamyl ligase